MTLMDTLHDLNTNAGGSVVSNQEPKVLSPLEASTHRLADTIRAEDRANQRTIKFVGLAFRRTVQWVRWAEDQGFFKRQDGSKIYPLRSNPPHAISGFRMYTFTNMADMAIACYENGGMKDKELSSVERFWDVMSQIRSQQLEEVANQDQVSA